MTEVLAPPGLFLRHSERVDPSAAEVLVFTFNHDLGYFESVALGLVQQTGARITVIADARMSHHDLYNVRRAGTAYLPGLAVCSGAFHPKVIVIAARNHATVAVGSGNLSLAGWQGNDELWSVHHADDSQGSAVVPAVGLWLRDLDATVSLSEGVPEALARTAALLTALRATQSDVTLVHSLHTPIIQQLPTGPVDHLALYAPFHDPSGDALRALNERFQPSSTTVALQPALTRVNGDAVAKTLGRDGEVVVLADSPYRHGKLIEWTSDGQRWALTGSPNLSCAALLSNVTDGGNVEVGVIAPSAAKLLPDGERRAAITIAHLPYTRRTEEPKPSVIIMSAVIRLEGIAVKLSRPVQDAAVLEASPLGTPPDQWLRAADIPAGTSSLVVDQPLAGGSRLRIVLENGRESPVAFVCDPSRILRTHAARSGHRRAPELPEMFQDPRAAEQFERLMEELRRSDDAIAPPRATSGRASAGSSTFEVGDWEEYLDRCRGRVGPATLAFALGIPAHLTRSAGSVIDVDWDDETIDDADQIGGLEDDIAEDADDRAIETAQETPQLHRAAESIRRRYRGVAERMIRNWRDPDPHERLLSLRFALCLVAGGAWPSSDDSWPDLLLDGVIGLDIAEPNREYEEPAGSLAALVLSIVRSRLGTTEHTPTHARFDRAADRISHLLVAAEPDRIAEYGKGLEGRFPAFSQPDIVLDLRDRLVADDPLADAVQALNDKGLSASAIKRVISLTSIVPDPYAPACEAMALAAPASPVVITAPGTNGWVVLLWQAPHLVVVRPGKKDGTIFSNVYRYAAGTSPTTDIRTIGRPSSDRTIEQTMAGQPLPAVALAILDELDLTLADLLLRVGSSGKSGSGMH